MIAAVLFAASVANAQSKKVRPPVAGDGKFYALPNDTVIPQEFYVDRGIPISNLASFLPFPSGDNAQSPIGVTGGVECLPAGRNALLKLEATVLVIRRIPPRGPIT